MGKQKARYNEEEGVTTMAQPETVLKPNDNKDNDERTKTMTGQ